MIFRRLSLFCNALISAVNRLPKTGNGVTQQHTAADDGYVQAGLAAPATRWVKSGNLCYDYHTGLCWISEPAKIYPGGTGTETLLAGGNWSAGSLYDPYMVVKNTLGDNKYYIAKPGKTDNLNKQPPNTEYWVETVWIGGSPPSLTTPAKFLKDSNFAAAFNAVANLTYAGVGPWSVSNPQGWRVPNILELTTLWDFSKTSGLLVNTTLFPNVKGGSGGGTHVSSTWTHLGNGYAYITFDNGWSNLHLCFIPSSADPYVLPVRTFQ